MRDLAGYTFTIKNKCPDPVNYVIGLESVEDENVTAYMDNSAIALAIDDSFLGTYDILGNLTGPTEGARASKELKTATVAANSTNTHNLKIWIDENASIENQSKAFLGKVFITGGQGVENDNPQITATSEACFNIDESGEILGYDESCGTSVTIPASVDGIAVRTIDTDAFRETTTTYNYDFVTVANSSGVPQRAYITDHSQEEEFIAWANANGVGSVEMNLYTETPTLSDGEMLLYCNMGDDINNICVQADGNELTTTEAKISIIGLDLSQALYLERIEKAAFSNVDASLVSEDDLDSFVNYPTSLTSLTFGEDAKELLIEDKAFARIDVDNLILYSSDVSPMYQDGEFITPCAYGGAIIDNLVIKATSENSVLGTFGSFDAAEDMVVHWYGGIIANKVTLEEGIKDINASIFNEATVTELILPKSYVKNATPSAGLDFATIGTLVLPNGITEIPASLFKNINIENITIPYTVETIGDQAFKAATIGNIVFEDTTTNPSQLNSIGYEAFMNFKGASEITLPSSLETIGEQAFGSCTEITKVTIPASVTSIEDLAFENDYNLTEVVFEDTTTNPSQLKSIGNRAFYLTPKVSNVTLPVSITSIGQEAFAEAGSGTLTVPMTEEVFEANVDAGYNWYGTYTVSYSS